MKRTITLAVAFSCAASTALACAFHGFLPQKTMVDRLMASEQAVLARQDPDNPFLYGPVQVLSGEDLEIRIPHLVDTISRRTFADDENAAVLFVSGAGAEWSRVAMIDTDMGPVLDAVLRDIPTWRGGDETSRFQLFASLLTHPDRFIRILALEELDRADYGVLSSLDLEINVDHLTESFHDPVETYLRPIRALLLGFSDTDRAARFISANLDRAAEVDSRIIGAFATAFIAQNGADAIDILADRYLMDRILSPVSEAALIEAMAIQARFGSDEMREITSSTAHNLLNIRPDLAPDFARVFGSYGLWSQAETLENILRDGQVATVSDIFAIHQYLAMADGRGAQASSPIENLK